MIRLGKSGWILAIISSVLFASFIILTPIPEHFFEYPIISSIDDIIRLPMALALGIAFLCAGFITLKRKRLIENIPTSKIRSLAMGLVEVHGKVIPIKGKTLYSPFSHKECVYYRFVTEKYDKKGDEWRIVKWGDARTDFFIKDDTGQVLVNPEGALIDDSGYKLESYPDSSSDAGNKTKRYREYIIEANNELYIIGTAAPYDSGDGMTNHTSKVIIRKGKNDKIYFISESHEPNIIKDLKYKSYFGIILGFTITFESLIAIILKLM